MKIIYIANSSIPSKSANSIHVMKMCEALCLNNVDITLIVPNIEDEEYKSKDIFEFYGINNKFKIIKNKLINKSPVGIYQYLYSITSILLAFFKKPDVIMTRNPIIALLSLLLRQNVILEVHGRIESISNLTARIYKKLNIMNNKRMLGLIVISDVLKKIYMKEYNVKISKIFTLHDGVNLDNFSVKNDLLSNNSMSICYMGSLLKGRGIDLIIDISKEDSTNIYNIYGGEKKEVEFWKNEIKKLNLKNIEFHGHIMNSCVPSILEKHDILLMPYQKKVQVRGNEDTSSWMSPMKMFEYMASEKVILSSDLPVLREILDENNSFLLKSSDYREWLSCVNYISKNRKKSIIMAKNAKNDVKKYTWSKRAEKIKRIASNVI